MISHQTIKAILFIGNHLSRSGNNLSVNEELSQQLSQSGWKSILSSRKGKRFARFCDMISTIITKKNEYSVAEVDIFSGAAFLWGVTSALVIKLLRKPLVLTLHGGNLPDFAKIHSYWLKLLLRWGDVVVAPSNYLKEKMSQFRNDIRLIPNGINIQIYPYRLRSIISPSLVWLRAFHEIYNPSLAPQVIKELQKKGYDFQLIMVGPDKKDGSLEKTIRTAKVLGVSDSVHIIPGIPKEEVPPLLNNADIFLNTTNYDNTPVSVLEAMACGLCVVSTNVGGIPYMLENEKDSLLIQPNDPKAIALAVIRLLTEPNLSTKLSRNARTKALQSDWSAILPLWDEVFKELSR